jgi:hypothetical protein
VKIFGVPRNSIPAIRSIFTMIHLTPVVASSPSMSQYVNRAAASVRTALKEPAKSKLASQGEFSYKVAAWDSGVQGTKTEITTLGKAGSMF